MQGKRLVTPIACRMLSIAGIASLSIAAAHATDGDGAFLPRLVVSSTIPQNGDLNPYGVAFVPQGFPGGGLIAPGDVLVSNFNNSNNVQGTGTTIIKLTPSGTIAPAPAPPGSSGNAFTFFTSTPTGLTTALGVLRKGFVLVGNVPTTNGTVGTISQGSLQIISRNGTLVRPLNDSAFLDTPWDLTINDNGDQAQVFVSNVKSRTVSRLDLAVGASDVTVLKKTEIAMGNAGRPDPNALIPRSNGACLRQSHRHSLCGINSRQRNLCSAKCRENGFFRDEGHPNLCESELARSPGVGVCAQRESADRQWRRRQRRSHPPQRNR